MYALTFLVIKNIGINRVGPVAVVRELFQLIGICAKIFHAGYKHISAVLNSFIVLCRNVFKRFFQFLAFFIQRIRTE